MELAERTEQLMDKLVADRKVRAVASAGSYGTADAWSGSVPTLLTFERGLDEPHDELRGGIRLLRWPYERLERWREWEELRREAPLGLLAGSRVSYDPTGYFARIQRTLWHLSHERRADWREELLRDAAAHIAQAEQVFRSSSGGHEHIMTLGEARRWATELLYPALLTHEGLWPEFELRLPHAWRAAVGMRHPRAVYLMEQLYGFGGREEARRVLAATRGLRMTPQEKLARAAFDAGYYDGAVRYLRDETFSLHRADIAQWPHLSVTRQGKLGTLLGITRSPLGPAALATARELLDAVRAG